MEGMFKGAGWLSLIALAAGASLTFVPDKTWESFPEPLAPVRARLASVGIAPEKYRPKETKEEFKLAEPTSKDQFESPFEQDKNTASDPGQRSRVRIHGDDRDFPSDDRALSSPVRDRFADPALDAPQSPLTIPSSIRLPTLRRVPNWSRQSTPRLTSLRPRRRLPRPKTRSPHSPTQTLSSASPLCRPQTAPLARLRSPRQLRLQTL